MKNSSTAWYALRRTLPEWRFDELLAELVEYAPKYHLDEVIVKIDTEDFSHGHPSPDWARGYNKKLMRLKEAMKELGVEYSLNPWVTHGHADRGRDDTRRLPGLGTIVGHDGTRTKHCACPLSTVWRDNLIELWSIYAETEPRIIWVEDDIRTFNHEPVKYGCFCEAHLAKFSAIVGRVVTREELIAALFQPGVPHPWRKLYLDMQRDIMIEVVGLIGKCVHAVSPETCLGLMSSGPRYHCIEGRNWAPFAAALADGRQLYSRPPIGSYIECTMRDEYYTQDSMKITRHATPRNTIDLSEVECYPYTVYAKSVNYTFLNMAISFAYGTRGVMMNLYDHLGTPMKESPQLGIMLAEKKAFCDALAAENDAQNIFYGVRILHDQNYTYYCQLEKGEEWLACMEDGYKMMYALEGNGISTTYSDARVIATNGQNLRCYSDGEIREMLSGAMFIDGMAAKVLFERGYGDLIGIKSISGKKSRTSTNWIISAEEYHNLDFGGKERNYMSATLPGTWAIGQHFEILPSDNAQVISSIVDADTTRKLPAMLAFQNSLGGRVVIHAWDYEACIDTAFFNPLRRKQMQSAIRWLSHGKPALLFKSDGAYPLSFYRKAADGNLIIGAFNLTLDAWQESCFELAFDGKMPTPRILDEHGSWKQNDNLILALDNGVLQVKYNGKIDCKFPLIIKLII